MPSVAEYSKANKQGGGEEEEKRGDDSSLFHTASLMFPCD